MEQCSGREVELYRHRALIAVVWSSTSVIVIVTAHFLQNVLTREMQE